MKAVVLAAVLLTAASAAGLDRGRAAFEKRCSGCHALDHEKMGPRLRGVFGHKAASVASFTYSGALKQAGVTWDEATLDKWIANPDDVASGNDMPFRLDNAEERTAIVEYLKTLSDK